MSNVVTGILALMALGVGLYVLYWICLIAWCALVAVWVFFTSRAFIALLMLVLALALAIGFLWSLGWCVKRLRR